VKKFLWKPSFKRIGGIVLLFFILYGGLPPLLSFSAKRLIQKDPLVKADVVVALCGDPRCYRERHALKLYRQGLARYIIVSGIPTSFGVHTGESAKKFLLSQGVPEKDIMILWNSWNTRREALDLAQLMRRKGWKSAIIVTSPFHSRRAIYTFRRYAPGFSFSSSPVEEDPRGWKPERWWTRRGDCWITVREFLAWANTLVGGLR
jgi:uncharacterized SAM-binding protein YcdF (DUF218 family)